MASLNDIFNDKPHGEGDPMPRYVDMPLLVQDRQFLRDQAKPEPGELLLASPIQRFRVPGDEEFFDGPITPRVAVLDFDLECGDLLPGTRFLPQGVGKTVGCYDVELPDIDDEEVFIRACESEAFIRVNTFATIMKTIKFFESPDALGRPVTWAFDSKQLLVLPRAGLLPNAFYERESGSLQFFYSPSTMGHMIYTALSHDIIVHETAHSILDGIAPDLYHATRTESLALHEAIADTTAIMLTLINDMIVFSMCNISSSQMNIAAALAKVAEEFGSEMRRDAGADFLRILKNRRALDPSCTDLTDPYEVSEVLSGAIYQVFINCANGGLEGLTDEQKLGYDEKRVLAAGRDVSRMVFRALDYLPPGEASLADFGRAMVAAHRAVHTGKHIEQQWLVRELVDRNVVGNESELELNADVVGRMLENVDCQELLDSKEVAERFMEKHRDLLRIPDGAVPTIQSRHIRTRVTTRSRGREPKRDLVFKVTWDVEEEHDLGPRFASRWAYPVGSTLVLDWNTGKIISLLTTDQGDGQYFDRDRTLRRWVKMGKLKSQREAVGLDGQPLVDAIIAHKTGNVMRATGSARAHCI